MRGFNIRPYYLLVLLFLFASIGVRAQDIQTVAGGGPNNVVATNADLAYPSSVATDSAGNFYIAAPNANRVYKVDASGQLTVLAGNGAPAFSGDGGPATSASLNHPRGVAVDSSGNVYIADTKNNRIREVNASTHDISTVAGNGTTGFSGDGGPATSAGLYYPAGVAVDSSGNIYIADTFHFRIREVNASTHDISTVAGGGSFGSIGDGGLATSAFLFLPYGVAVDGSGNIYIADTYDFRIREVDASTHIISTVAGNGTTGFSGDGGPATSAGLAYPQGVAVDRSGNIYIADTNHLRIREVDAFTHDISTVAGNGTTSFGGDGGPATSASLAYPQGVAVDSSGNVYIADTNHHRIREVDASTHDISTVAGNGTLSFVGDGGPATSAGLNYPRRVAVDGAGNIYIADTNNNRIRKVDTSGNISTVAGNGTAGFSGDSGAATSASLNHPQGVAVDGAGNIYIADTNNNRIREVDASTHNITTVAGNGYEGYCGDSGPATSACLSHPYGVALDGAGNIYIADSFNNRIREVDASTHDITTVAGSGNEGYGGDGGLATSASFWLPFGVAVDGAGNIYIADHYNNRIRKVDASTHIISTVAGNGSYGFSGDGGAATSASLRYPYGVAVDGAGNIYIADTNNNRIREVDASTHDISTVAGDGSYGFSGDGGPATSAMLANPSGVAVNGAGNIYIADSNNQRIREVTVTVAAPIVSLSAGSVDFGHQQAGTQSLAKTITVQNTGTADLHVSGVSLTGDFLETNKCISGAVAPRSSCTISVSFLPTATGSRTGTLTITDDAADSPQLVDLSGTGDYGFVGFLSPYQPPSAGVAFKIGSSIPLKWQYTDANGSVVNSSTFAPTLQINYAGACGGSDSTAITLTDAGSSGYQYDSTTNTWQFNWKTKDLSSGCYSISAQTSVTSQSNGGFLIQLK